MADQMMSQLAKVDPPSGSPPTYASGFTNPTTGAMLLVLDTTDTTMAASGTDKRFAPGDMIRGFLTAGTDITLTETSGVVTIASTASGSPGGASGTIQYNNSSAFGGFTMSGDASIVTSTGVITVTKTNGNAFANSAITDTTNATNISSGTLAVARGGTGLGTLTAHAVVIGNDGNTPHFAAPSAGGKLLIDQGAAADPSFNAMSGDATITSAGAILVAKTNGNAFANSAITDTTNATNISSGTLAVARGGTGLGTLTAHAVVIGNDGSAPNFAAPSAGGKLLIDQGAAADPSFNAMSGDATITSAGALTIGANKISYSKMQNTSVGQVLLGNPTGSAAVPSEITLAGGLAFASSTLTAAALAPLANPTFTGTVTLPDGTVALGKMANLAATSLIGNATGSAAAPQALTLAGGLAFAGSTVTAASLAPLASPSFTGNVTLVETTSSSTGVIMKGATPFIHNYTAASTNGSNTFVGETAGNFTMAFSSSATDASYNVGVGTGALPNLTTGNSNVGIGVNSLAAVTTGYNNMGIGNGCLSHVTTGHDNMGMGYGAFQYTTGSNNVGIGTYAGQGDGTTTCNACVGIGSNALISITTGSYNVGIGYASLQNATSGQLNSGVGYYSGAGTSTGTNNLFLGSYAGIAETGSNTIMLDTINRTTQSGGRAGAILYAITNATPANQTAVFNAVVKAPLAGPYVQKTTTYPATALDRIIECTAASPWTLTLPAANVASGFELTVIKTDNNANAISVTRAGSDLINGSASAVSLAAQYKYVHLVSDGTSNWYNIGSN